MTIAIVTHRVTEGDGQGRVNLEITRAALHQGHEVMLIASDVDEWLQSDPAVIWQPVRVAGYPTELIRNQVFAWKSYRWIRQHRHRIDRLLVNGAITWGAADVNVAHFVHGTWLRSPVHTAEMRRGPYAWYQWLYTALNARWEQSAFRQAQVVIAVSEQVRRELTSIGVPVEKIRVIPNGVDLEEFTPGPPERDRFHLPNDVPLGVFVGDLRTPRKNLDTVLRALSSAPNFHLAVAGDVEGSPYPQLARKLGIEQRVYFLGFCDAVPALMRSADVCVCPSRYEPFSLVLLEALAAGCPVLTARTVGAANLLPPDAGWIVDDPEDVHALARHLRTIDEVARDTEAGEILRCAARSAAEAHGFTQMAQTYMHLLEQPTHRMAASGER